MHCCTVKHWTPLGIAVLQEASDIFPIIFFHFSDKTPVQTEHCPRRKRIPLAVVGLRGAAGCIKHVEQVDVGAESGGAE